MYICLYINIYISLHRQKDITDYKVKSFIDSKGSFDNWRFDQDEIF